MSRFGFWLVMLAAFCAAGGMVGYVGDQATAQAPTTPASVQTITVFRVTAGDYVIQNGTLVPYGTQPIQPSPDDPVVPPVVVPSTVLAKTIVAEISKLPASDKRHTAAMKLTATYQMLAGQVRDGKIHPTNAEAAANLICPIALGTDGKEWSKVFAVVNAAVALSGTADATADVFDDAAVVVLSTVPASGDLEATAERYGFDWTSFLAFLMELLKILLPLIIS